MFIIIISKLTLNNNITKITINQKYLPFTIDYPILDNKIENPIIKYDTVFIKSPMGTGKNYMLHDLLKLDGWNDKIHYEKTLFKKMQSREIRQAGIAVDATLGLRANSFSDIGDLFGSRFAMERALNQTTGIFFIMNGLNYWNQTIKEFTLLPHPRPTI